MTDPVTPTPPRAWHQAMPPRSDHITPCWVMGFTYADECDCPCHSVTGPTDTDPRIRQAIQLAALSVLTEHSETTFMVDDTNDLHVMAAQIATAALEELNRG